MKKKKLALRLAQILVVLVGISFVTFLLTYLSPGDPVRNMYTAAGIMPTEELVAETREELGLNDPLPTQYLRWLRNCLRGDFGKSYTLNKPVTELLLGRLWPTVKLTLLSMGLMLLLAVPLGMLSAVYKDRWIDYLVRGLTFVGCAMPNFWVGLLLMLAFCVHINVFPVISSAGDLRSIFLPALTLALAMSSKYTRQVRTAVLEEMNQDYVVGARARGVRESVILWRNVFPNALLPQLHGLCSMVRFLLRAGNLHDTLDHLMQKPCLRGVGSAVVDLLALAARDDQPACFQRAQMMRDGRAGHVHHCRDIDHARLAVAQQPENPHARRISQLAEYVRNCLKFFRLLQFPA